MLYGTAHDALNNFTPNLGRPVWVRPSRSKIPVKNPASPTGLSRGYKPGLHGLSAPAATLTNSWIVDPTYGTSLMSIYGTIPFSQFYSNVPMVLGSVPKVVAQSGDNLTQTGSTGIQYVTLVGNNGASISLTIKITATRKGASVTYTAAPQAATLTPAPVPVSQPTPDVPQLQPGAQVPVSEPQPVALTVTANNTGGFGGSAAMQAVVSTAPPAPVLVPPPPLDNGFLYVLPLGASPGYYSIFGIPSTEESRYTVYALYANTGAPGIANAPMSSLGFNIAPSEVNDVWEIQESRVQADPDQDFILWQTNYRNLTKQGDVQSFKWNEPSGAGGFLGIPAAGWPAGISRVVADIGTWGYAEVARAGAQEAGVSQQTIDQATEAYAIASLAVATAGVLSFAASAPAAEAVAAGAFPTALDAGSATATLILPTTEAVAVESAAGSTLLPASLSLIAPASVGTAGILATVPAVAASEAAVAPTASAVVAPTTTQAGGLLATTTGIVAKTAAATALSTGAAALSTEIKKLTGQLPAVTSGYNPGSAAVVAPATAAAIPSTSLLSPKTLLALGGVGLLALMKHKG